mgnify:CR=1 FL=1
MNLKSELRKFFKYFEGPLDKEMFQIYHQALSKYPEGAVIARLHDLICNRDKTYKMPAISEIIAPYVNARKEHVWKRLMDHLKNPYDEMSDDLYLLKKFLEVPVNRTEYAMSKIKDQFFENKYDEFRYFLEGKIKIPSLSKEIKKLGINTENIKQLEASDE